MGSRHAETYGAGGGRRRALPRIDNIAMLTRSGLAILFAGLLAARASCDAEAPSPDDFEVLDNVVTPEIMEDVCQFLVLSDAQRDLARRTHAEYHASVSNLESVTQELIHGLYEQGNKLLEVSGDSDGEAANDELAGLMNQVAEAWADANHQADAFLAQWWAQLETVLADEQHLRLAEAKRLALRRFVYRAANQSAISADLSDPIDVITLVEHALAGEAELAPLSAVDYEGVEPATDSVRSLVGELLEEYARTLDDELRARERRFRNPTQTSPEDLKPYDCATEDGRRRLHEAGEAWYRTFRTKESLIDAIASIADEHVGLDAANAFRDRFWRRLLPTVFRETWVEQAINSLSERRDLTAEQRLRISAIADEYDARRFELRRRAVERAVRCKRRWSDIRFRSATPENLAYARAILAIIDHDRQTARALRLELMDGQSELFDRLVADGWSDSVLRLYLFPEILSALGREPFYSWSVRWDHENQEYVWTPQH